jgi:tripartite-type tricarboxylate transporter receptor subunit TctC
MAASPPKLRLVLGFSKGSASHNVAQAIVPPLAAHLGRPVELELHPGSSGVTAARMVAAAAPDGNTLLVATLGTHALVPATEPGCGYHPLDDFTPISLLLQAPLILAVPPACGIDSVAALIQAARDADPPLAYGSSAIGGAPHLAAELFAHRVGIRLRHARYSDTRALYADLLAGRIALSFNNLMSMLPLIRARRLVALATTGKQPHPALPDIPRLAAAGLGEYAVTNWLGIVGPAGLPPEAVARFAAACAAATRDAAARDAATTGVPSDIVASTPAAFGALIRQQWQMWTPIVRELGWTAAGITSAQG